MKRVHSIAGIAGLIMGLAAIAYASVYPAATVTITAFAVVAMFLTGWCIAGSASTLRQSARKQATLLKINNWIMIVFACFIVLLVNLIARQYYYRADLSATHRYTLAPQSEAVARGIGRETEIFFFGTEGGKDYQRVRDLMEMYRYLNRNIVYTFYDLDRAPLKAKEYGVVEYNTLVLHNSEKTLTARGSDEEAITNLLIRGNRRKVVNIAYLQGHNERSPSESEREGYGNIFKQLAAQGYNLRPLDLRGDNLDVGTTDLLIVAAPQAGPSSVEYQKIWDFRQQGGKFLVLVDGPRQFAQFLKTFGVSVSDSPIYDSKNVAGTDPATPLVDSYPDTPITHKFSMSTVYPGTHAVYYREELMLGFRFEPLVRASAENWLEANGNRNKDAGEEAHPLAIAALVSHPDKLVKMVVFGDSDFVANGYLGVPGNASLFINAVNWLCGEGAMVSVAPAKSEFVPMFVSDQQSRLLRLLIPVGIPVVVLLAGTGIWLRRKRL